MVKFNIVLLAPEIPGNTGTIGRTCLALGAKLHLIRPYGFDITEKALRRAGLDYWKHVELFEYDSFDSFLTVAKPDLCKLFFFSKGATKNHFEANFCEDCYLVFGSETKGLPEELFEKYSDNFVTLLMFSDKIRSINLANAVTAAAYEVVRQQI